MIMVRKYQRTQQRLPRTKEMPAQGMTQKEVENAFGLTGCRPVHELLKREQKKPVRGVPKQRDRKSAKTLQEYKHEKNRPPVPRAWAAGSWFLARRATVCHLRLL